MSRRRAPQRAIRSTAGTVILLAAVAGGTASCGGAHTGAFQDSGGQPNCQVHQSAAPSKAYTGGTNADTEAILTMMRYQTAHRAQPYCDGRPASNLDKAWAILYMHLSNAQETTSPS